MSKLMKRTPVIKEGPDGRKWYTWVVEISVSETWVEDGFQFADDEEAQERFSKLLDYAYQHEYSAKVVAAPTDLDVAKAQGYKTAAAWRQAS